MMNRISMIHILYCNSSLICCINLLSLSIVCENRFLINLTEFSRRSCPSVCHGCVCWCSLFAFLEGWIVYNMLWKAFCMLMSSNGNIFRVTGLLCGEFTGHRWIPLTKASDECFDVFFDLRFNNRLSKQSRGWWFETSSRPLWRHRNRLFEWWKHKAVVRLKSNMRGISLLSLLSYI